MKMKILFCILTIAIILFSSNSISQDRFSIGLKGGIGIWRFVSLQESPNMDHPIKYSYPIGFSLGLYIENNISEHFLIINELLYQNSITEVTLYPSSNGILDEKIATQYIRIPILLKYKVLWLWDTYILFGPSFGYLIKANYNYYDQFNIEERGSVEITKELPTISTAIEFSIGKEIDISCSPFSLELRAQWDLTKSHYKISNNFYPNIGKWNNFGLLIFASYRMI